MKVVILIATRNKSIAVKTLHTLFNTNVYALQHNIQTELCFVPDEPFEKVTTIIKKMKTCDRLVMIDYSVNVDVDSIAKFMSPLEKGQHCVIFPCVTSGVDWTMFKHKVRSGSKEPVEQMGLNFDTEVDKKIGNDMYTVKTTDPKVWAIDTKPVIKALKDKKGETIKLPAKNSEIFEKFQRFGVKIYAYTAARVTVTYAHECLGNILETAGVSRTTSTPATA
jgi:hypothetical protein